MNKGNAQESSESAPAAFSSENFHRKSSGDLIPIAPPIRSDLPYDYARLQIVKKFDELADRFHDVLRNDAPLTTEDVEVLCDMADVAPVVHEMRWTLQYLPTSGPPLPIEVKDRDELNEYLTMRERDDGFPLVVAGFMQRAEIDPQRVFVDESQFLPKSHIDVIGRVGVRTYVHGLKEAIAFVEAPLSARSAWLELAAHSLRSSHAVSMSCPSFLDFEGVQILLWLYRELARTWSRGTVSPPGNATYFRYVANCTAQLREDEQPKLSQFSMNTPSDPDLYELCLFLKNRFPWKPAKTRRDVIREWAREHDVQELPDKKLKSYETRLDRPAARQIWDSDFTLSNKRKT